MNNKLHLSYLIEGSKEDLNTIPKKLFGEEWLDSLKFE